MAFLSSTAYTRARISAVRQAAHMRARPFRQRAAGSRAELTSNVCGSERILVCLMLAETKVAQVCTCWNRPPQSRPTHPHLYYLEPSTIHPAPHEPRTSKHGQSDAENDAHVQLQTGSRADLLSFFAKKWKDCCLKISCWRQGRLAGSGASTRTRGVIPGLPFLRERHAPSHPVVHRSWLVTDGLHGSWSTVDGS